MNHSKLTYQFTKHLIYKGIIPEEDEAIYAYGFQQAATLGMNLLWTLALAFILDMALPCLFFFVFYIPLRIFGGGYHARTPLRCEVLSFLMILVMLLGIRLTSHVLMAGSWPNFQPADIPWIPSSWYKNKMGTPHLQGMLEFMGLFYSFHHQTLSWRLFFAVDFFSAFGFFLGMISSISCLLIWFLSPMEDANKPLDEGEVLMYGRIARRILLAEIVLCFVFFAFEMGGALVCLLFALWMEGCMLGVGWARRSK